MRIDNWRDGPQGSSVRGEFSVYLEEYGLAFHFMKIVQSKNGHLFVGLPRKVAEGQIDQWGNQVYAPVFNWEPEKQKAFLEAVMRHAKPFLDKKRGNIPADPQPPSYSHPVPNTGVPYMQQDNQEEIPF